MGCANISALMHAAIRPAIALVTPALAGLLLAACSAVVNPDREELGAEPQTCDSGTCASCRCPNGQMGKQVCNANGTFEQCVCPENPLCGGPVAGSGS